MRLLGGSVSFLPGPGKPVYGTQPGSRAPKRRSTSPSGRRAGASHAFQRDNHVRRSRPDPFAGAVLRAGPLKRERGACWSSSATARLFSTPHRSPVSFAPQVPLRQVPCKAARLGLIQTDGTDTRLDSRVGLLRNEALPPQVSVLLGRPGALQRDGSTVISERPPVEWVNTCRGTFIHLALS